MDTTYDLASGGRAGRTARVRVLSIAAALTLVVAALLLLQEPAQAQFGIVCNILQSLAASFANSPFFAFIENIINALLAAFGCVISG